LLLSRLAFGNDYESNRKSLNARRHNGLSRQTAHIRKFFQSISDEEKQRLRKLRHEAPEAFRKEIKKRVDEFRSEQREKTVRIKKLRRQYINADNETEKQKALKAIRRETEKEFKEKMAENKRRLEEAGKRLKELKAKYEERKKRADEIIKQRVKDLVRDPALQW
jgi:chromosome segregation ATPase